MKKNDTKEKQSLGKIEVMSRQEFEDEIARKNMERDFAQEIRYKEMNARKNRYIILKWTFRVVTVALLLLMWKTVIVPILPIVKPFIADLFGAQKGPDVSMSLKDGLYVNGYSATYLRTTLFACFLKFSVYSAIFVILRRLKGAAYKALVG